MNCIDLLLVVVAFATIGLNSWAIVTIYRGHYRPKNSNHYRLIVGRLNHKLKFTKEIFKNRNMKTENMSFGEAIEALKSGKAVQRVGWNGKGMYIFLEEHFQYLIPAGFFKGKQKKYEAVICMFTAQETTQPGWLASQADILSNDWQIVEIH